MKHRERVQWIRDHCERQISYIKQRKHPQKNTLDYSVDEHYACQAGQKMAFEEILREMNYNRGNDEIRTIRK